MSGEKDMLGPLDSNMHMSVLNWLKPRLARRKVMLLVLAVMFGAWWWISAQRGPVEIAYCLKGVNHNTPQYKCLESRTLRIPRDYYYGNHLDYSRKVASDSQRLEVAYPSMQSWNSVPWRERSSTQKIELELRGMSNHHQVGENMDAYFLGTPKATRRPNPLLGLDVNEKDGNLILLPLESIRRVGIWCANGNYPQKPASGSCWTYSHTGWGLNFFLSHEQVLLPQWAEVNAKVIALVNSFAVTP